MPVTQPPRHAKTPKTTAKPTKAVPTESPALAPSVRPAQKSPKLLLVPSSLPPHRFPVHIDRAVVPHRYSDAAQEFFVEKGGRVGSRPPQLHNPYLRPHACFVGEQQSGSSRYEIKVEFKSVDLASSEVTGFFEISGLTDDHPVITTCFRGEIINNPLSAWPGTRQYSFATEESGWGSFLENDLEHWRKLTGVGHAASDSEFLRLLRLIHSGRRDALHVYMRWKEEFLVPDLRVKSLKNALFEGFYYVVLNVGRRNDPAGYTAELIPGSISGLYYHTQNEKFQSLVLRHVETRGPGAAYEFA